MDRLAKLANKINFNKENRYHVFICVNEKKSKCCQFSDANIVYEHLKKRLNILGLYKERTVLRSKAHCLGICYKGPIVVVYPDGIWYHSVDSKVMDRIIEEHLIKNKPVKDYIIQ